MFSGERESLVILTDTHAAPCALTHTHTTVYTSSPGDFQNDTV